MPKTFEKISNNEFRIIETKENVEIRSVSSLKADRANLQAQIDKIDELLAEAENIQVTGVAVVEPEALME